MPIASPCGAFIVVLESAGPARLCAVDVRGEIVTERPGTPACIGLEEITESMFDPVDGEFPMGSTPVITYDIEPAEDE